MSNCQKFNDLGFIHLKQVIPNDIISSMQKECNRLLIKNTMNSFVNNTGCIIEPTFSLPNGLYLASSYCKHRKLLKLNKNVSEFITGQFIKKILLEITKSNQIFLLNEQYIVKPSNSANTAFKWHQDSSYLPQNNLYISVWIPLDDISSDNGSIFMLPFDNPLNKTSWNISSLILNDNDINNLQNKTLLVSELSQNEQKENKENIENKKIELLPKIGDMIIFTSFTYHKSNPNISNKFRRAIDIQYSTFPIIDRVNKKLARLVVKL